MEGLWSYIQLIFELLANTTRWSYDYARRYRAYLFISVYMVLLSALLNWISSEQAAMAVPIPLVISQVWGAVMPENAVSLITFLLSLRAACVLFLLKLAGLNVSASSMGSDG